MIPLFSNPSGINAASEYVYNPVSLCCVLQEEGIYFLEQYFVEFEQCNQLYNIADF